MDAVELLLCPNNLSGQIPVRSDCCQVYQETRVYPEKLWISWKTLRPGWLSMEHFTPAGSYFGHPSSNQILLFSCPPTSKSLTKDFMDLNLPTQQQKAWKCFLNVIETGQGLISFKIFKLKE